MLSQIDVAASAIPFWDHLLMATLLITTAITLTRRRQTWHIRHEAAATITGTLLCIGLLLCSPQAITLNPWIAAELNEQSFHLQYVAGFAVMLAAHHVFLYDLSARIAWTPEQRRRFVLSRIELPVTILAPTLVGAVATGTDRLVYPLIVAGFAWTLGHVCFLLYCIRTSDKRAPLIVNLYLLAFALSAVGATIRYYTQIKLETCWEWRTACAATVVLMTSSIVSWQRKQLSVKSRKRHKRINGWDIIYADGH